MNEVTTIVWLRHTRGHLWHRYAVTAPLVAPIVLLLLPGDKSWMRKWPDYDYDKRNISVVFVKMDNKCLQSNTTSVPIYHNTHFQIIWIYSHCRNSLLSRYTFELDFSKFLFLGHFLFLRNRRGRDRMVVGFITIDAITNVVCSNPAQAKSTRYNILWWTLSVTYGRSVHGFLWFPPPIKLTAAIITEILLEVALNTITLTLTLIPLWDNDNLV